MLIGGRFLRNPEDSEYAADDGLGLSYSEEILHSEIGRAVTAENHYRQRDRMPRADEQLECPTDARADQRPEPEPSGVTERQTGPSNSFVEAAS